MTQDELHDLEDAMRDYVKAYDRLRASSGFLGTVDRHIQVTKDVFVALTSLEDPGNWKYSFHSDQVHVYAPFGGGDVLTIFS